MPLEAPVPCIVSSAPLFGVCEKATALASTTSAVQQISFITMPLEVFNICVLPFNLFLGCLLGGRPNFLLQKSESKFHLCAIKFPGKRWPGSLKLQTGDSTNAHQRAFNTSCPLVR